MKLKIKRTSVWVLGLFALSIILAACSPAATAEPTLDPDTIFTQAAETVAAQLTRTALSLPTATSTMEPTPTLTNTPEATSTPETQTTESLSAPTVSVGSTANPNKMTFVSDVTIPDGQVVPPGAKFVKTWRIRNTGTTTWTTNYWVRLWAGDSYGAPTSFLLGQEVAPNAEVDISIEFTAPTTAGEYTSHWILSDDLEANFGNTFYVNFVVGTLATSTSTQVPSTATATVAPTEEPTATP